jgi:hypothetical protein
LVLVAIFVSTRHSTLAARIILGIHRDVARMNPRQYEAWVDHIQLLEISSLQERLAAYAAQGRTRISVHDLIAPDRDQKAGEKCMLLSECSESPTASLYEMSLEVGQPAGSALDFEKHRKKICLGVAFASLALLSFGLSEPYTYAGLMYRRHWCGLVMAHGGNGCLFMQ